MASINPTAFRAYKGRLVSIGLTYPSDYPEDPKLCKKHLEALHKLIASSWYEICGELCEDHLLAGTRVEEVQSWKRAMSYVEKYVAKPERFPEGIETGRIWGT